MSYMIFQEQWYLAYQDGACDDVRYETEQEAKAALKKLGKLGGRGICVMSKIIPVYKIEKL